jgi:hypothetical protein
MATMKRCLAQLTLTGVWGSEHLFPGLEINFDRELAPGVTVRSVIAGRENCFEDVIAPDPAPAKNRKPVAAPERAEE